MKWVLSWKARDNKETMGDYIYIYGVLGRVSLYLQNNGRGSGDAGGGLETWRWREPARRSLGEAW